MRALFAFRVRVRHILRYQVLNYVSENFYRSTSQKREIFDFLMDACSPTGTDVYNAFMLQMLSTHIVDEAVTPYIARTLEHVRGLSAASAVATTAIDARVDTDAARTDGGVDGGATRKPRKRRKR